MRVCKAVPASNNFLLSILAAQNQQKDESLEQELEAKLAELDAILDTHDPARQKAQQAEVSQRLSFCAAFHSNVSSE